MGPTVVRIHTVASVLLTELDISGLIATPGISVQLTRPLLCLKSICFRFDYYAACL